MPSKKSVRPKTARSSRQSTRTRATNSGNRSSILPQREVTKISTRSPAEPAISNCIEAGVPMDPEENSKENERRTITKTTPNGSKRARLTGGGSEALFVPVRNYGSDQEETVDPVIQSQLHTDQKGGVVSQPNGNSPHQNTLSRRREPTITVEVDEFGNATSDAKSIHEKHNHLKGSLVETLRDKRVITAACLALKAKCDEQEKELMKKTQHISVLEAFAHSRVRKGKKIHVGKRWSSQYDEESSLGQFDGIGLALRVNLTKKASLLVTESYFDDDHGQLRDWRGSVINASTETVAKTVMFVVLQDGTKAIPSFAMIRALKGGFYDWMFKQISEFVRFCVDLLLRGRTGQHLSSDMKQVCIDRISVHRPTLRRFRIVLSDSVGARKKAAKMCFLKMLGNKTAATSESRNEDEDAKLARRHQKKIAFERCFKKFEDGEVDTSQWRTRTWKVLCLQTDPTSNMGKIMRAAEREVTSGGKVDNLFFNEAARADFHEIRGYNVSQGSTGNSDVSILTLTRCDAWITTAMKLVCVESRGEQRNFEFTETFKYLLPRALERIIEEICNDIRRLAPQELLPSIADSQNHPLEKFGNNLREWTVVVETIPENKVFFNPSCKYFNQKVCSWCGNVKDCQIGICRADEKKFEMISMCSNFDDDEESDIEDGADFTPGGSFHSRSATDSIPSPDIARGRSSAQQMNSSARSQVKPSVARETKDRTFSLGDSISSSDEE